ncbi:site-specific integrase [Pseudomonas denitrificans (nom. rej.)]|uniref:Integrase n=1 Tax=Pseudomonas denitrificans TaxID=43306 RepID=A0A9X7R630_PSEDE|nr:integrase [Pseudomonas denitrificans (nom. rej.)]QEY74123.1 integrase [Pseudomonas denitrificans (nom. rej.)]
MRRSRKRKHNPNIPAHIDQAAIPAAVFFDHRGKGNWYTLDRDEAGKQHRQNIATSLATLSELHRIMEERAGVDRDSLKFLCSEYHDSPRFKRLSKKTQDDYTWSRDVLLVIPTRLKKPLGELAVRKFTPALIQRIIDNIAAEGTPSKAAHALRYLRLVMQWGRNRGYLDSNPAQGIEAPIERKQRRLPSHRVMLRLIERAQELGRLKRGQAGACPAYLGYVMELAYLCRLRGIETVTLTDANELPEGILTNRRKGSRDNIVTWTPRLRAAWEGAKAHRAAIWAAKSIPSPIAPERRHIIVAAHGGALQKSSLDTAWQRFITTAIEAGIITAGERFGLHDLKRRGITDTPGTRADKQEASGHRDESMLDIYDLSRPLVAPSAD